MSRDRRTHILTISRLPDRKALTSVAAKILLRQGFPTQFFALRFSDTQWRDPARRALLLLFPFIVANSRE